MRKLLFSVLLLCAFLVSSTLFAAYEDTNTGLYKFESTLIYFAYSTDGGSTYTVVYDDATGVTVDMAVPDSATSTVGEFLNGENIPFPEGETSITITHLKVRFPWDDRLKGWVRDTSDDTIYITKPDTTTGSETTTVWTGESLPTESDCEEVTLPSPDDQGEYNESIEEVNISIEAGEEFNIIIDFTLGDMLTVMEIESEQGSITEIVPADTGAPTIRKE